MHKTLQQKLTASSARVFYVNTHVQEILVTVQVKRLPINVPMLIMTSRGFE